MKTKLFLLSVTFGFGFFINEFSLGDTVKSLAERLKVVGSIKQYEINQDEVGIVVLRDDETEKTVVVQIGRPFTFNNQVFLVDSIDGQNIMISDGVESVQIPMNEGRNMQVSAREEYQPQRRVGLVEYGDEYDDDDSDDFSSEELAGDDTKIRSRADAGPEKLGFLKDHIEDNNEEDLRDIAKIRKEPSRKTAKASYLDEEINAGDGDFSDEE